MNEPAHGTKPFRIPAYCIAHMRMVFMDIAPCVYTACAHIHLASIPYASLKRSARTFVVVQAHLCIQQFSCLMCARSWN